MKTRVLIAGAGPVGLFAGLRLAQAGVDVVVLEQRAALGLDSKASTFHAATLELLNAAGVADRFLPLGVAVDELQWRDLDGGIHARLPFSLLSAETRYPFRLHAEQTQLTPLLADRLTALQPDALRFQARAGSIREDADGVRVTVHGPDGPTTVTADYVLAADGAGSGIREQLGVGFPGDAYASRALRVITHGDLRDHLPGLAGMTYVRDDRGSCSLLRMRDHWRFIFRVVDDRPDEELLAPEAVRALVDRIAPGVQVEDAHLYSNRHHVADTFRQGRVLFAGDAAHITTTAGGMNMNCGLHDAFDLASALAAVVHGDAGPDALAQAADRRRRVVSEVVIPRTEQRAAGADGQSGALASAVADLRRIAGDEDAARRYLLEASMFDTRPPMEEPGAHTSAGAAR
ncbi:FAD-dependent monooxygenase [Streptomyces sp. NPDC058045]|uniref:FAD-dependent monooxygenase n=1 Tax=Streptomyces sp. NPDC058045 TaxID=3346311 RepID=UPI0036E159CC